MAGAQFVDHKMLGHYLVAENMKQGITIQECYVVEDSIRYTMFKCMVISISK